MDTASSEQRFHSVFDEVAASSPCRIRYLAESAAVVALVQEQRVGHAVRSQSLNGGPAAVGVAFVLLASEVARRVAEQRPRNDLRQRLRDNPCPADGLVIDPFAAGGTTVVVGRRLGRCAADVELHGDFVSEARRRIAEGAADDAPGSLHSVG